MLVERAANRSGQPGPASAVQDSAQPVPGAGRRRQHGIAFRKVAALAEWRAAAAGLGGDQEARQAVPGVHMRLPIAREAARGDMGEHERPRAVAEEHAARPEQPLDDLRRGPGRGSVVRADADDPVQDVQGLGHTQGPAVEPYTPSTAYGAEGQILYRKFDWQTGQPLPDSDTRGDWAQDPNDHIDGRRVQYPGWDLDAFARPTTLNADGEFTVALGPDNLFDAVNGAFTGAQHSIRIEGYTFEHLALGQTLAARAAQGVDVTLLLEGGPPGGISDQQRYITQLIEDAGGQVWFMVSDRNGADDRYANQHAKFAVIDDQVALISSENFSGDSMPDDDKSDGTLGRRGSALLTTAHAKRKPLSN